MSWSIVSRVLGLGSNSFFSAEFKDEETGGLAGYGILNKGYWELSICFNKS